jgi:YVTN family beta-propeller protein
MKKTRHAVTATTHLLAFFALVFSLAGCDSTSTPAGTLATDSRSPAQKFIPGVPGDYVAFESGQVRPLAMSADGNQLYAVNTPDNHLEIFDITATGLIHRSSVPVGMEPVAVATHQNQVWVVNHLSDSISIVDTNSQPPRVTATLLVGDEPRDIVFAGNDGVRRAFITTAHRGQHSPYSPTLMPNDPGETTRPGIGRADVWVFDAAFPGAGFGGSPETVLSFFTDTPRALAVSPDDGIVYVAGFHTGNRTTAITEGAVCDLNEISPCSPAGGPSAPGSMPPPNRNIEGATAPDTGLIVKFNGSQWVDELNRDWSNQVLFNLPDTDVFAIDANGSPPRQITGYTGIGTVLYNMVTNPVSGKLYVSNTEARNDVRFEGTRTVTSHSTVVGHVHEARITVIDPAASNSVTPRHLNKHIDYNVVPAPATVKNNSLATPTDMVLSADGSTLYVAAFGSAKVGVFNTTQLENDSFVPDAASHISVSGGGPSGLLLNPARNQLYVFNRFDNSISIIDTLAARETRHYRLFNPEPASLQAGRPFLYDATFTSSNGEASCSSCHVFGDLDSLAWDLGDPEGSILANSNLPGPLGGNNQPFHPMKGPMTTQSLRGMANHGPMHWRGDRSAANGGGDPLDEAGAFMTFNVAFEGLLGRDEPLSPTEMSRFTDFILQLSYPPNPNRPLDNSMTAAQQSGADIFFNARSTAGFTCNQCHVVDPPNGLFGSSGLMSFEAETQEFKIPHLRNMYQKVGMFGMPINDNIVPGDSVHMGNQIRGFGFTHDGSVDSMFRFHGSPLFVFSPTPSENTLMRRQVEQFMHAMESSLKPVIGQQTTLTSSNASSAMPRISLFASQMDAGHADVIVKGQINGQLRGWVRLADGSYQSDDAFADPIDQTSLLQLAQTAGQQLTFTAVPPGSGIRMGVDRDNDAELDFIDNCPDMPNSDQTDTDGDGIGDACPPGCYGDFDNDGDVDGVDASTFSADFGSQSCHSGTRCEGDFDNDGDVDGVDASHFANDFGRTNCPIN